MAALMAILDSLVHHCIQILYASTFHDHQIFYKEAIFGVPPCMKYSRSRIKQITKLLVINLEETCLDVELFFSLRHLFEEVAH